MQYLMKEKENSKKKKQLFNIKNEAIVVDDIILET